MKLMDPAQKPVPRPDASPIFRVPAKRRLILSLLLALITLALYNPITHAPFLNYDDNVYVTENSQVRAGLTASTIRWSFLTPAAYDWHPLTWLSYAMDAEIFGMNPAGYHFVNVLLHAANAVLLFLILETATGFAWRSLAVATLFALHPINVESVAWIAERKNVLSMLFFLVALAAYGWYARRPGIGRYLAVTLAYVFALMSKAQVITFPFALLLLDYWPLNRLNDNFTTAQGRETEFAARTVSLWRLLAEKVPWIGLSAVSAVITMKTGGAAFSYLALTGATETRFPLWVRFESAAIAYVQYLWKIFWPANLALAYPHPGFAVNRTAALMSAIMLIAVSILAVVFRRHRPFFVGWFWFVGTMLPMSGALVQIAGLSMADRYAYIPLLGIFVILCWGVAELIERWHVPPPVYASASAVILLTLGLALHRQLGFWRDNVTLWSHTLQVTKQNFVAEEDLAMAYISEGRAADALPHFQRAHKMFPDDPLATMNIATYDQMLGRYQSALNGYASVIQARVAAPSLMATAFANSGYAHLSLKQYDSAKQDFEGALRQQPLNSSSYRGLGLLAERAGNIAQAAKYYEQAVELQPTSVGYLLLAHALDITRQPEAARAAQVQATQLTPDINGDISTVRQLLAN
jgi:tetratricopeptide (TPR) repeat protein